MKGEQERGTTKQSDGRRRFLGLLGGTGFLGLMFPLLHGRKPARELDLREADFYRDHDLAG